MAGTKPDSAIKKKKLKKLGKNQGKKGFKEKVF